MRYGIRIIAALGLVALLVPVAAVAKDARVTGPAALVGAGYYGGELELAMEEGQRPVKLAARAGYIGVLDLAGDLKIRCVGTGRLQKQETENGIVYRCAGRQGRRGRPARKPLHVPRLREPLHGDAAGGRERHLARPLRRPGRARRRPGG